MDVKKLIYDLLLVIQNLNTASAEIFCKKVTDKFFQYEIHSPGNIPAINMWYSTNPTDISDAEATDPLGERGEGGEEDLKEAEITTIAFNENIIEALYSSGIIKKNNLQIVASHNESVDSRNVEIGNSGVETNKRATDLINEAQLRRGTYSSMQQVRVAKTLRYRNKRKKMLMNKRYIGCSYCKREFKTIREKNCHEKYYTGERLFPHGEVTSFHQLRDFKKYEINHRNRICYKCDQCGKTFRILSYFENHKRNHCERLSSSDFNKRCYVCEFCGRCFSHWES